MRLKNLYEGVTFGNKQKQEIINDPDIRMGIEYEFYSDLVEKDFEEFTIEDTLSKILDGELGMSVLDSLEANDGTPVFMHISDNPENIFFSYKDVDGNIKLLSQEYNADLTKFTFKELVELHSPEHEVKVINDLFELSKSSYEPSTEGNKKFVEDVCSILRKNRVKSEGYYLNIQRDLAGYIDHPFLQMAFSTIHNITREIPFWSNELVIDDKTLKRIKLEDGVMTSFIIDSLGDMNEKISRVDLENVTFRIRPYSPPFDIDNISLEPVDRVLMAHGIDYDRVELDFNSFHAPVEVVSNVMTLKSGLTQMKTMFELMGDELDATTDKTCGMHVSLSYKNGSDVNDAMVNKFISLLAVGRIDELYPKREHTSDLKLSIAIKLFDMIFSNMDDHDLSIKDSVYHVMDELLTGEEKLIGISKFQSINIKQLKSNNGRVELRYFGGNDSGESNIPYESRDELMHHEILRAAYLLRVAYSDDYDKEFKKTLYKLLLPIIEDLNIMKKSFTNNRQLFDKTLDKYKKTNRYNVVVYFERNS